MPESYEQRNERSLQAKQFCHLGCAFSSCCSDKNLFLRELSFQPESITFAFKRDCKSPPISLLHSFPVFAAHIFTVSTFSQLWIQIGKLWTARQGPAVSLWRRKSFEFLLPQPPSTKYFIQALCYHLITQHLELTGVSSTNTTMEWEWMHEGMRSLKEEHPNALSACSRAGFLQAPSNSRGMLEEIWETEKGDWITFSLNIIKILSRKLQHKMSYAQLERVETGGTPMVFLWKCCKSFAAMGEMKTQTALAGELSLWSEGLATNCQHSWRWGQQCEEEEVSDPVL